MTLSLHFLFSTYGHHTHDTLSLTHTPFPNNHITTHPPSLSPLSLTSPPPTHTHTHNPPQKKELEHLPHLTTLDMSYNLIKDMGPVRHCPKLEVHAY